MGYKDHMYALSSKSGSEPFRFSLFLGDLRWNDSHMNYSLLAWGANCHSIELLQKRAVRVINFKSPLAHTEPILKGMDQLKLPDMFTCHLIKLYYKLYRNQLPTYFENFIPEYAESQHDLRHNNIRLPAIRCEYEKINAKYQMHY